MSDWKDTGIGLEYTEYINGTKIHIMKPYGSENYQSILVAGKYILRPIMPGVILFLGKVAELKYGSSIYDFSGEDINAHIAALGAYILVKSTEGPGKNRFLVNKATMQEGVRPSISKVW